MKAKWKEQLTAVGRGLATCFRDFPAEALLCLTIYVLMILADHGVDVFHRHAYESVFLFAAPQLVLMFCLHRAAKKDGRFKGLLTALYFASYFLWIPVLLWYREPSSGIVIPTYIISFLLLLIGTERQDDKTYAQNILQTLLKGITAGIICAVLAGVIAAIIGSVDFLFIPDGLHERWYLYPSAFCGMVIFPLLCCLFLMDGKPQTQPSRFLTILVDGILSPGILIYTVILYLYILRILIRWELPDGGVAYMVGSYISVALVCRLLQEVLEKRHFDWFYRCFPAIAAAPLILLWVGIARRIGEYGLTEARFFLILTAALLTLFTGMLIFPKSRSFQRMTALLALGLALFSFIPGIRARDFGLYSQQARLARVLPLLKENPLLEKEAAIADGALGYLYHELPGEVFFERYGAYKPGEFALAARNQTEEGQSAGEVVEYSLEGPVDLGEYTRLIPSSQYHYYEDAQYGVFYKDDSRTEELIRCDITSHLDNGSADQKLVFRNERYLVVYQEVWDYRSTNGPLSFTTGGHSLFAKP